MWVISRCIRGFDRLKGCVYTVLGTISLGEGSRLIVRICLSTRGVVAWWPQAVIG